jgi:hypothetical protein
MLAFHKQYTLTRHEHGSSDYARIAGEVEVEVLEAYLPDMDKKVARLDKYSMKALGISAGKGIIIFGEDHPVIVRVSPLYPSDKSSGALRIGKSLRKELKRDIGSNVTVRGIGDTKIDKVVNYLLLEKLSEEKE